MLTRLIIRAADLVAIARHDAGDGSNQMSLLNILDRARDVDADLERWSNSLIDHWQYTPKSSKSWPTTFAYQDRCDTYYDVQIAAVWNCYRRARVILLELISSVATMLDEKKFATVRKSAIIEAMLMADDICASLPFILGTRTTDSDNPEYPSIGSDEADAVHWRNATIIGWFLIVLPLQRLGKCALLGKQQQKWVGMQCKRVCAIVAKKHSISTCRAGEILETAIPAFASMLPINSRHLRYVPQSNARSESDANNVNQEERMILQSFRA